MNLKPTFASNQLGYRAIVPSVQSCSHYSYPFPVPQTPETYLRNRTRPPRTIRYSSIDLIDVPPRVTLLRPHRDPCWSRRGPMSLWVKTASSANNKRSRCHSQEIVAHQLLVIQVVDNVFLPEILEKLKVWPHRGEGVAVAQMTCHMVHLTIPCYSSIRMCEGSSAEWTTNRFWRRVAAKMTETMGFPIIFIVVLVVAPQKEEAAIIRRRPIRLVFQSHAIRTH